MEALETEVLHGIGDQTKINCIDDFLITFGLVDKFKEFTLSYLSSTINNPKPAPNRQIKLPGEMKNKEAVLKLLYWCADNEIDYAFITHYQIRLKYGTHTVDVFPKSSKFFDMRGQKWHQIKMSQSIDLIKKIYSL